MTDLKSRADELIVNAEMAAMTVTDSPSLSAERDADESHAALTRFVHAMCDRLSECERSLYLYSGGTAEYFDRHPVAALEKGEKA